MGFHGIYPLDPSGKRWHNYGLNHHVSWENWLYKSQCLKTGEIRRSPINFELGIWDIFTDVNLNSCFQGYGPSVGGRRSKLTDPSQETQHDMFHPVLSSHLIIWTWSGELTKGPHLFTNKPSPSGLLTALFLVVRMLITLLGRMVCNGSLIFNH